MTLTQLPHFPYRLVSCAASASVVAALGGCGAAGSGNGGMDHGKGELEKPTITVAGLPLVDAAGVHIALHRGLFKKEGLTVRVRSVHQSIQAMPALAKGQIDVLAGTNYVTLLQAQDKGTLAPRILGDGATVSPEVMGVLVPKGSPIKKAEDLRGEKVAVNIVNNIQSLALDTQIAGGKQPTKTGIEYRQVPFPQMRAALQRKQVDAAHVAEPFLTGMKRKTHARQILDGGGPVEHLPISGFVTTRQFTEDYPKTAAAFGRAVQRAQQIAARDRGSVEKVLPGYTRIDAKSAETIGLPHYPADGPEAGAKRLARLADLMRAHGLLKGKPDIEAMYATGGGSGSSDGRKP